jgi:serine phosphatase RsbU (regulator of sigma subunit)/anti-sigma regulatory factor (Ser/Thr protein kinase)
MGERRDWPAAAPALGDWPAPATAHLALTGIGGFDWDLRHDRIHFDPQALRVLGLRPGEFDYADPASLLSRLPATEAARIDSAVCQALKEGHSSWGVHFRLPRPDGSTGWTHARGQVLRDGDGRPSRVIGVVSDATDTLAQAAELLREGDEDRFEQSDLVMEVTATLSRAVTVRDVTTALTDNRRMIRLGIASLFLGLVEGDRVHVVAEGQESSFVPELQYTRIDDDFPMSEVVRTLEPRFVTSPEEFARRYPPLWPHIEPLDATAAAYLPLIAQSRPIGAIGFLYRHKHSFSAQERNLLIALSGSIAQSLQRAMLFDQEHDIAQGLQTAMLPRRIPEIPGARVAVRYRAARLARDIGGDWYDVVPLPGGRVATVIGDVQGHDTHATAVMGQLRIALRAYAAEGHPPATVMARASAFLYELDTDRFATCLYAEIDPASGVTGIVRAGHIEPLVRKADGTCRTLSSEGGLPLGLSAQFDHQDYRVTTTEIGPGETLLMFTDGLVERPGGDLDDGLGRLAQALSKGPGDVQELADHISETMHDQDIDDDMALLLLQRDSDTAPDQVRRLHQHVGPGDPQALTAARAMVRRAAETWGMPERAEEAELAAGELVTNALVHTDAGAVLSLRLLTAPVRRMRVEVYDLAPDWPRRRIPGYTDTSGRGLLLVDRLADAWGVEPHGAGKSVWCEFKAPGTRFT